MLRFQRCANFTFVLIGTQGDKNDQGKSTKKLAAFASSLKS